MKKGQIIVTVALLVIGCSHGPEGSKPGDCQDRQDNDNDGRYDCDDDGCAADSECVAQARMAALEKRKSATVDKPAAPEKTKGTSPAEADRPFFELDGLLVQAGHNGQDINHRGAKSYCERLILGRLGNWRLPNREEALKIVKDGRLAPESYVMWTSTLKGKKRAVIVGITSGAANDLALIYDGQCRARCVRDSTQK